MEQPRWQRLRSITAPAAGRELLHSRNLHFPPPKFPGVHLGLGSARSRSSHPVTATLCCHHATLVPLTLLSPSQLLQSVPVPGWVWAAQEGWE